MSEANERLCEFLYLPQTWCAWDVRVYSPANFKLDQLVTRGGLRSGLGYEVGRGFVLAPGEMHECAVPAGQMCECCMFAGCTKMEQSASRGPMGWVRGSGSRQGYRGDRGAVPVLRGSMNMRVLVNGESVVSVPALVTSCLCQPKTSRGCGWLFVFYASPVDSNASSVAVCVTGPVSVLCVGVSVCVHLWDACSALLQITPASGKVAAASLSLGRLQIPRHQVGLQQPGRTVLSGTGLYWAPAAWQEGSWAGVAGSRGQS